MHELETTIDRISRTIDSLNQQTESLLVLFNKNALENLIEDNPELTKNEEFMLECLDLNLNYISLDKTMSPTVYLAFLEKFKTQQLSDTAMEQLKRIGYTDKDIENILTAFTEITNEIKQPKEVEVGKYKIPHEYIFRALQSAYTQRDEYSFEFITTINEYYKSFDGKFSKEHGEKLQELYTDSSSYLYLHNITYRAQNYSQDEILKISNQICKNGLRLTTSGNEVGQIKYTTLNSHEDSMFGIFHLMSYWDCESGILVLQIPKDLIDNNGPIIGSDIEDNLSPSNPGYILPKFVVGSLSNGRFVNNPYSLEERKRYEYVVGQSMENELRA